MMQLYGDVISSLAVYQNVYLFANGNFIQTGFRHYLAIKIKPYGFTVQRKLASPMFIF